MELTYCVHNLVVVDCNGADRALGNVQFALGSIDKFPPSVCRVRREGDLHRVKGELVSVELYCLPIGLASSQDYCVVVRKNSLQLLH